MRSPLSLNPPLAEGVSLSEAVRELHWFKYGREHPPVCGGLPTKFARQTNVVVLANLEALVGWEALTWCAACDRISNEFVRRTLRWKAITSQAVFKDPIGATL